MTSHTGIFEKGGYCLCLSPSLSWPLPEPEGRGAEFRLYLVINEFVCSIFLAELPNCDRSDTQGTIPRYGGLPFLS